MADKTRIGLLARAVLGQDLPLKVLQSQVGSYIGTGDDEGPISRESEEYWFDPQHAQHALENDDWTQRAYTGDCA